jgi:transketolase
MLKQGEEVDGKEARELNRRCREVRYLTMDAIGRVGVGHVGGSMSVVETLVVLYYRHMRIDPRNPRKEGRDRFVLSKGHAGPALYAVLGCKGYFDTSLLATLNAPETLLPSHCDMNRTPGVDMTAGSLGQGISCAVGIALGARLRKDGARVYCIIGDGESQEGQVWEAAMYAAHMKLDNLIAFTDYNRQQLDAPIEEINSLEPLLDKWTAFGWNVINVRDGHNVEEIDAAIVRAKTCQGKPSMIILNTIKGEGVSFAVAAGATPTTSNHNMLLSPEQWRQALEELKEEEC